jgi:ascorbate-specific PTS system EIIC-type component UlaA
MYVDTHCILEIGVCVGLDEGFGRRREPFLYGHDQYGGPVPSALLPAYGVDPSIRVRSEKKQQLRCRLPAIFCFLRSSICIFVFIVIFTFIVVIMAITKQRTHEDVDSFMPVARSLIYVRTLNPGARVILAHVAELQHDGTPKHQRA